MTSASFPRVVWISFLFASDLSFSPSRKALIKFLDQFLSSFSGKVQSTKPAKCTNILISCLLGSLMRAFKIESKSVGFPKLTLPFYSMMEVSSSAATLRFYQLALSFSLGINLCISIEISLAFSFALPTLYFLMTVGQSDKAYP